MPQVEKRLTHLEKIVAQLAYVQMQTEMTMQRLAEDQLAFKEERPVFKDEKDVDEVYDSEKQFSKAWRDLANKLGTILEDIVAPNIRRLALTELGFDKVQDFYIRPKLFSRRGESRQREFDVVCKGSQAVILAESKSTWTREAISEFAETLGAFFDFFPEYENLPLIGVIAGWNISEQLHPQIADLGLYGVCMADDTMQILVRPKG
ncbi:MAG: hypothetical protein ACFCU3_05850 [Verrucomicrobiales bacterium]